MGEGGGFAAALTRKWFGLVAECGPTFAGESLGTFQMPRFALFKMLVVERLMFDCCDDFGLSLIHI